jgi:hypothetical protein
MYGLGIGGAESFRESEAKKFRETIKKAEAQLKLARKGFISYLMSCAWDDIIEKEKLGTISEKERAAFLLHKRNTAINHVEESSLPVEEDFFDKEGRLFENYKKEFVEVIRGRKVPGIDLDLSIGVLGEQSFQCPDEINTFFRNGKEYLLYEPLYQKLK